MSCSSRIGLLVALILTLSIFCKWPDCAWGVETRLIYPEFSGLLIKTVNGNKYQAQVFAKGDRLRLEYQYALKTDRGDAAIEIIRLDKLETWYVLAQRKELLVTPLDRREVLPIRPTLPGEKHRVPDYYFDEPPGYIKHMSPTGPWVLG